MGTGQEETGRTDLASRAPESSTGRRLTSRPNTFLSAFPLFALDFYNFLAVFLASVELLLPNGSRNKKCVTSPFKLTGRSPFFQHSRDFPQEFYFVGQVNSAIPNCPSNRQTFGNHNESKPKISWEKNQSFFPALSNFSFPCTNMSTRLAPWWSKKAEVLCIHMSHRTDWKWFDGIEYAI